MLPSAAALRRPQCWLAALLLYITAVATFAQTPLPAFEDSMAQRTLACTACHGEQGRAAPDGYHPRLAGKPAGYLYHQLLNFRDGRRHYGPMTHMVDVLSDDYLWDIARHFAAQQVPYPPPPRSNASATQLERGRQLALQGDASRQLPACAQCHGRHLMGAEPHFPALIGLPADYLTAQLGGWQTGQRQAHAPDCMAKLVRQLGSADAHAVVSWLASQPVPPEARPDAHPPDLPEGWSCGSTTPPATLQHQP